MKTLLPKAKSTFALSKVILITLVSLVTFFGNSVIAQTIGVATVTGVPACAGTSVSVEFDVSNGTGSVNHYNSSTVYNVYISDASGNNFVLAGSFSDALPTYNTTNNGVTTNVSGTFTIQNTLPTGNGYLIAVSSSSPSFDAVANAVFSSAFTINEVLVPSLSISVSPSQNICSGTTAIFTATPVNGGANPAVEWFVNGSPVATGMSFSTATILNGDQVMAVLTSDAVCATPVTVTSNTLTMTVNTSVVPSVTIISDQTEFCQGATVNFSVDELINGGLSPVYQWKVNGVAAGTNSPSFSTTALNNNDIVTLELTSNAVCATPAVVTSNAIAVTVNPLQPVSVSVVPSSTIICAGGSVTFTATPVNGGSNPAYQWKVNGVNAGTNSDIFTTSSLNNNDVVTVELTSDISPCPTGTPAMSLPVTITVNPLLPVSVTATASSTSICSGESITFNALPVNGGSNPAYQWKINGIDVPGANSSSFISSTLNNGDAVSVELISDASPCATGSPAISNSIIITVNPQLPVSVSISASSTIICAGTSVTFNANPVNGGTPSYQWLVNGLNAGSGGSSFTTTTLANNDQVSVILTSNATCATGSPASSNSILMTVNPVQPVSVTVVASSTTICAGESVTFTASVVNGGNAAYQWKINGSDAGSNSNVFTTTALANNDVVTVTVTSDANCATNNPATSAGITMTVNPQLPVSVSITASSVNICSGTAITFTATPVNGGTASYQWLINDVPAGINSSVFTTSALANGDIVKVVMTSGLTACTQNNPATSNSITITVNPNLPVGVSVSATSTIICSGTSVTFTATPVNGGTPSYQWKINGVNAGSNSNTFTTSALSNNDVVTVVLTSSETCTTGNPATSNPITMTVNPNLPVSVSISASSTTICAGTSVTFTATAVNGGGSPVYQWYINNNPAGSGGSTFTTTTLANNDAVKVVMTSSASPCATGNPATSNTINMSVTSPVTPSVSITASSTSVCSGTGVTFTATSVNGGSAPMYQWKIGAANYGAPTSSNTVTISTLTNGQSVSVVMTSNANCASPATATSNSITITVWTGIPNNTGGPANNRRITGPSSICPGPTATGLVYTAPVNLTNTATYTWTVPSGFIQTPGPGANQITVSVPGPGVNTGAQSISLVASNPCGSLSPITFLVTISSFNAVNAGADFAMCANVPATLTNILTGGATRVTWTAPVGTISGGPYPTPFTYSPPAGYSGAVTLTAVTDTAAGSCNPSSAYGTDQVTITVSQPVSISDQPVSQTVCSGGAVNFSVTATGTGISYQWRRGTTNLVNGGNISGVNTSTLALTNVTPGDNGNYNVVITGTSPCTAVTSANASLTVNQAVTISAQPAVLQTVCTGNPVTFTVNANGTGLTYQWRKGTTNLIDGGNISGATTSSLNLLSASLADAGNDYNVVVSGTSPCTPVTSANASLAVNEAVVITSQPLPTQTVCSGTNVSFSVAATGSGLSYQWRKGTTPLVNGGNISGATTATLTINNTSVSDNGNYNVVVSGASPCTPVISTDAVLIVNQAVSISTQPLATQSVCAGNAVSFSVAATGTGLSYQWRKGATPLVDGGTISGATTSTLSISSVVTGDAATDYNVVISGVAPCNPVTSTNAVLVVNDGVIITSQPAASQVVCSGASVSFSVSATGSGITYQWRKGTTNLVNGVNISGVTTATLTLTNTTSSASGNYNVIIYGAAGCSQVISADALLVVNDAVVITTQPAATQTVCTGGNVSFMVSATGSGLSYQWRKGTTPLVDGGNISGSNTPTLNITNASVTDAGNDYNVVISGITPCTPVTSINSALTVNEGIQVVSQPEVNTVACSGATITFSVSATGTDLTYQWRKGTTPLSNGSGIAGATSSTLTLSNLTLAAAGNYNVVISGAAPCSQVISNNAVLTINQQVTITSQPALTQTVCTGNSVSFNVSASGTGLTYQWRKGTTPLANGGNISGATSSTLTINPVLATDAATDYNVVVSGVSPCSPVESGNSALVVREAVVITEQPLSQAACSGSTITLSVTATGTGLTYRWRKGTTLLNNAGNISGVFTSTLTISNIQLSDAAANYNVLITGTTPCAPLASANATITVNKKVTIGTQPSNVGVCASNPASFGVIADGTGLTYQWYKGTFPGVAVSNTATITGAQSNILNFSQASLADAGIYYVMVSGVAPCAPVKSNEVTLNVDQSITVTSNPVSQTVCTGLPVSFSVSATAGGATLTYQWRKGGVNIGGANSSTYSIPAVNLSSAGTYDVVIAGPSGFTCPSIISLPATLTVQNNSSITLTSAGGTASQVKCVNTALTNITYAIGGGGTGASITAGSLPAGVTGSFNSGVFTISGVPSTPGVYNYTVTTSGPCVNNSLSGTITVNDNSTLSLTSLPASSTQSVCINTPINSITYAIGGGATGASITAGGLPAGITGNFSAGVFTISGSPSVSGTFGFTVTTTGPCINTSLSGTITVIANATINLTSAAATANQAICVNTPLVNITYNVGGSGNGAVISAGSLPAGVTGVYNSGVFTISGSPSSTGTFNYTITTTGPCANQSLSGSITVRENSSITLTSGAASTSQSLCINNAISDITYTIGGGATGASITSGALPTGVTGTYNAGVFTINGTPTATGTFNYTVTTSGPCINNSLSGTITVRANSTLTLTSAAATASQTVCINSTITAITYSAGAGATGIVLTSGALPAGVTGTYNSGVFTISGTPSVAGIFNYTLTTTGLCVNPSLSGTITVNGNSVGGTLSPAVQIICYGTNTGSISLSGNTGSVIRWESSTNGGGTWAIINNTTTTLTYNNLTQPTLYRAVVQNGPCGFVYSAYSTIVAASPFNPTISASALEVCINQPSILTASDYTSLGVLTNGDFQVANPPGWSGSNAASNNGDPNSGWGLSNGGTYNGVYYNSTNKFMIITGTGGTGPYSLSSPTFSMVGLTSAYLVFNHAFNLNAGSSASIEISINGGASYTTLQTFTGPANFGPTNGLSPTQSINLNAYLGLTNLKVRFSYTGIAGSNWAIDNINISNTTSAPGAGIYDSLNYTWSPGTYLNATTGRQVIFTAPAAGTYTVNVSTTTSIGCAGGSLGTVTIVVRPEPTLAAASSNTTACSGSTALISLSGLLPNSTSTITYTVSGGPALTATVTSNASGNGTFNAPVLYTDNGQQLLITSVSTQSSGSAISCPKSFSISTTLSVNEPASITAEPASSPVCVGTSASLTMSASGTGLGYQWQVSTDNGVTWNNITAAPYSGFNTNTLVVNNPTAVMSTYLYRSQVTTAAPCNSSVSSVGATMKLKNVWTGNVSIDWNNPANWSDGAVPSAGCTDVYILGSRPFQPTLGSGTATIHNLVMLGGMATVNGSGTLQISGNITGGAIDVRDGSVDFNGSVAQTIAPGTFVSKSIRNLTVTNTTLTLNDSLFLFGELKLNGTGKTFATNNLLTLRSTATGTANVAEIAVDGSGNALSYITGNVMVERFIPATRAWRFLSIPTNTTQSVHQSWQESQPQNSTALSGYGIHITSDRLTWASEGFDLRTPAGPSMKMYNPVTDGYNGITSTYNPIKTNQGYMVIIRGDRTVNQFNQPYSTTVLRTKGTLYTGKQPSINVTADQFMAIGNPYASAIDFSMISKTGGVQDVFYVWDPKLNGQGLGAFQTFVGMGGGSYFVTPGGGSYSSGNTAIESGQAFLVRAVSTPGSVAINENAKVSGSNMVYRPAGTYPQIKVKLSHVNNANTNLVDGVVAQYDPSFEPGIDAFDAVKLSNNNESMSILSGAKNLVVERRDRILNDDTIKLKIDRMQVRNYQFEIIAEELANPALRAYLEDRYAGTLTPISLEGTTIHNFSVVNQALSYAADRFRIVFKKKGKPLNVITRIDAQRNIDNTVAVEWKIENSQEVEKYEIERSIDGTNFTSLVANRPGNIFRLNDPAGEQVIYYRLKTVSKSGDLQYSNIARVDAVEKMAEIMVYPNPVINHIMKLHYSGLKKGMYTVSLVNASGQEVFKKAINLDDNGTSAVPIPQSIGKGTYYLRIVGQGTSQSQKLQF